MNRFGGTDMLTWARHQLGVARDILDNPGGGLLFATQAIGQVKAALAEQGRGEYDEIESLLDAAEEHAVRREYDMARARVTEGLSKLS